jgi:hypothetical protein
MAFNPAMQFGIKEVADVAFYKVGDIVYDAASGTVKPREFTSTEKTNFKNQAAVDARLEIKPVLKFDTLKTSGLEFTGETTEARGGKGNTVLMSWDHSREATLTLEDALLSAESLAAMLSNTGANAIGEDKIVISVDAKGFPDTYTVVGKTYAREAGGTDHLLTFLIFKAKVNSEANFEMSADGDPSTLNMTLKVLRCVETEEDQLGCESGDMVKLIIDKNNSENGDIAPDTTFFTNRYLVKTANDKVAEYLDDKEVTA